MGGRVCVYRDRVSGEAGGLEAGGGEAGAGNAPAGRVGQTPIMTGRACVPAGLPCRFGSRQGTNPPD
jgi:hypothetical protein